MAKATFKPFASALSQRMEVNVTHGLDRIGEEIRRNAVESVTEFGVPSPNHIVSQPGRPPNADTRTLDRSIKNRASAHRVVEVIATAPYSAHLEWGTKLMAARPYMRPALFKSRDYAVATVAGAIARAVQT